MLKMQLSMAHKFTLQPLRRYDIKPLEKPHKHNIKFDPTGLQETYQHVLGSYQGPLDPQPDTLPMRHTYTYTNRV